MSETDGTLGQEQMEEEPPSPKKRTKAYSGGVGDNCAESVIKALAYVILVVGLLFSIMGGLFYISIDTDVALALLIMLGGSLYTIVLWALTIVVANISVNIRQIKRHLLSR